MTIKNVVVKENVVVNRTQEVKVLMSLMRTIKGKLTMSDYFVALNVVNGNKDYYEVMDKLIKKE